jgi:retron-type reverse transcriptase
MDPSIYFWGSVVVKVTNDVGRYFQMKKGLKQGDPLSPILFNLVVDMLFNSLLELKRMDKFKD